MARESYSAAHSKLQKEIDKLQKKQADLLARQRKPAIDSIIRTMRELGITPAQIEEAFGSKRGRRVAGQKRAPQKPRNTEPKYKDPDSSKTWSGFGRAPAWIVLAEQNGGSREQFLINK